MHQTWVYWSILWQPWGANLKWKCLEKTYLKNEALLAPSCVLLLQGESTFIQTSRSSGMQYLFVFCSCSLGLRLEKAQRHEWLGSIVFIWAVNPSQMSMRKIENPVPKIFSYHALQFQRCSKEVEDNIWSVFRYHALLSNSNMPIRNLNITRTRGGIRHQSHDTSMIKSKQCHP